jgi:hypothetical protein
MLSPADIRILTALYNNPATPVEPDDRTRLEVLGVVREGPRGPVLTSLGKEEVLATLLHPGPDDGTIVRPSSS